MANLPPMIAAAMTALLLGFPAGTRAQSTGLSLTERLRLKAPLEETDRRAFFRSAGATDRAVAPMDHSRLSVYTYNFGLTTGRIFSSGRGTFPNEDGTVRSFYFFSAPAFAVEAGPWHPNPMVHECSDYHSLSKMDWEAKDGSRGGLFQYGMWGYPIFAVTDLPATWPSTGWPAPEEVVEVWLGTDTWHKWERRMQREAYGIFDDKYADREGRGDSIPLGIEVQFRALTNKDDNIVYFQYEFTNTSSNHFTGVYLGQIVDSGSPTTNDWSGAFLRYDQELPLLYAVSAHYDQESGSHSRPSTGETVSWVGTIWLDTPTGSLKEEEFRYSWPPWPENPSQILTRVALLNFDDRILSSEPSLYGAMSGDVSHMELSEADRVWKTGQNGGVPVLKQTEEDYKAWNTDWENNSDLFYYVASGPVDMPPGTSLDYVFAIVGGYTEGEMRAEAFRAIEVYNDRFIVSSLLPAPRVTVNGFRAGPHGREYDPRIHNYPIFYTPSGRVTLNWDGQFIESTLDAASREADFEGYRVYRSSDRGLTWGEPIHDPEGRRVGWVPMAQFDLVNGIRGTDPIGYRHLGDDTGIRHTWTDTTVFDGLEYWYTVTSYDRGVKGDEGWVSASLESPIPVNPNAHSLAGVIAGPRPPGYRPGGFADGGDVGGFRVLLPAADERSTTIGVRVVDEAALTGGSYQVDVLDHYQKIIYHLHGVTDRFDSFERGGIEVWIIPAGEYRIGPQRCDSPGQGYGETDILDGFRVEVSQPNNANGGIYSFTQTTDAGTGAGFTVLTADATYASVSDESNRANLTGFMNDLEVRFTGFAPSGSDTNLAHDVITRGPVPDPSNCGTLSGTSGSTR